MAIQKQAGFSLVELMITLAISGSLAVLAFAGQRSLRSQAQFDAAVDKLVGSIADARNEATAGVNVDGPGDGSQDCLNASVPGGQYVFAGITWSAVDAPGGGTFQMDFYAADRSATPKKACVFDTHVFTLPSVVRVNPAPGSGIARSVFIRDDFGALNVCAVTNAATNVLDSFKAGNCTLGAVGNTVLTLNLSDADGHSSLVQVDASGLAKRVN